MTRPAQAQPDLLTWSSAVISDCGQYRYRATRRWDTGQLLPAILFNPSTMDGDADDPTGRRLMGFARAWGFAGFELVNLYAFRATSPKALHAAADPCGPENWRHIKGFCERAVADKAPVLCAWGALGNTRMDQDVTVVQYLQKLRAPMVCLGKTKGGFPRHPLYVRADQHRETFP